MSAAVVAALFTWGIGLVIAACVSRVRDRRARRFHARAMHPAGSARIRERIPR